MKRKYISTLSEKECKSFIKENVDFISFNFTQEHFTGWTKFGFFSIAYKSGKIKMYNPIFNKAIGRITSKNGGTMVSFRTYKGLTDIFSLLFLFVSSFIILLAAGINYEFNVTQVIGLSVLCCAFASSITFVASCLSEEGQEGESELCDFIQRSLSLKQQVKGGLRYEKKK